MEYSIYTMDTHRGSVDSDSVYSESVCTDSGFSDIMMSHNNGEEFESRLFYYLSDKNHLLSVDTFKRMLCTTGLRETDPRLKESMENLREAQMTLIEYEDDVDDVDVLLNQKTFTECIRSNIELITKAFSDQFVISEFKEFRQEINNLYYKAKNKKDGQVATYIPQLARYNPNLWGVSICTVDGQRHSIGDTGVPFCLQSVSKALVYALAMEEHGTDYVHKFVGKEPSGRTFNSISLDNNRHPHNPMINPGAMVTTSLLMPGYNIAHRYESCMNIFKRLAGGEYMAFNNSVFLSEKQTADRNFAIGYYLKENKCFSEDTDVMEVLEFYFMQCSIEVNCDSLSLIAATLANGGVCPVTGDRVLSELAVRNTLSVMHSCGMADYSGHFAFEVGLPAKAGVSGAIMLVVPNVMGIALWSPPLDMYGNSCRGVQFCQDFVARFSFHTFDRIYHPNKIGDYKRKTGDSVNQMQNIASLLFGASIGDLTCVKRFVLLELDMELGDKDGRTALHVAAAEGRYNVVKYLLDHCKVSPYKKDRWNSTPLDDARRFGHGNVAEVLELYMERLVQAKRRSLSEDRKKNRSKPTYKLSTRKKSFAKRARSHMESTSKSDDCEFMGS